jgi:hypothetical protein
MGEQVARMLRPRSIICARTCGRPNSSCRRGVLARLNAIGEKNVPPAAA